MRVLSLICLLLVSFVTSSQAAEPAVKIGIFGDVHRNTDRFEDVLLGFKQQGVTHIIGAGDYSDGVEFDFRNLLRMITPLSGVPKDRIFLMKGNWEADYAMSTEQSSSLIREFAQLVSEDHRGHGIVKIGSSKVFVSHFPLYPIPAEHLPEKIFKDLDAAMKQNVAIPSDVDLVVFGDTHHRAEFTDPKSGKVFVNVGTLSSRAPKNNKPGYAVFDPARGELFSFELGRPDAARTQATRGLPTQPLIDCVEGKLQSSAVE